MSATSTAHASRMGLSYNERAMVRLLDRYVWKELVPPFAIGVGVFTFFLIIDRIYQLTTLVITKNVPFQLVLSLLVFLLPAFLSLTLPMALLVAVLLVGGRLAGDLEVAALKAAGVSPLRLFRPFVAAALLVTVLIGWLTLVVRPVVDRRVPAAALQDPPDAVRPPASRSARSRPRSASSSSTSTTSLRRSWRSMASCSPTSAIRSAPASWSPARDACSPTRRTAASPCAFSTAPSTRPRPPIPGASAIPPSASTT